METLLIKLSALRTLLKNETLNSSGMFVPYVAIHVKVEKDKAVFYSYCDVNKGDYKGVELWNNGGQHKHNKSDVYDYIVENIEEKISEQVSCDYGNNDCGFCDYIIEIA